MAGKRCGGDFRARQAMGALVSNGAFSRVPLTERTHHTTWESFLRLGGLFSSPKRSNFKEWTYGALCSVLDRLYSHYFDITLLELGSKAAHRLFNKRINDELPLTFDVFGPRQSPGYAQT